MPCYKYIFFESAFCTSKSLPLLEDGPKEQAPKLTAHILTILNST